MAGQRPEIHCGYRLEDHGSTFTAYIQQPTTTMVQVAEFETHVSARVPPSANVVLAFRLDGDRHCGSKDGWDWGAGAKTLHLLSVLEVDQIACIVAREWGGVSLGPQRLVNYVNCVRDLLRDNNLINFRPRRPLRLPSGRPAPPSPPPPADDDDEATGCDCRGGDAADDSENQ